MYNIQSLHKLYTEGGLGGGGTPIVGHGREARGDDPHFGDVQSNPYFMPQFI